jgi:Right handed beta helix region
MARHFRVCGNALRGIVCRMAVLLPAVFLIGPTRAEAVSVQVSPPTQTLAPQEARQFAVMVTGTSNTAVIWLVNGIPGGTPSLGLISSTGLYVAPADVPAQIDVEIEAQSVAMPLTNGAAAVAVTAAPASPGQAFYVATTGDYSHDGSAADPWRTIQHAVDNVSAGATINVESGVYNELVTVTRSGSAGAGFITVTAAPGMSPIVDGTGLPIPNGENGLFTLDNVSFVRIIGFKIRNYRSSSAALDPIGIYVIGAGSNIEILNNHVEDIITSGKTASFDALGIAVYGTSALTEVILAGNELDDLVTGFSESLAVTGNVQYWEVTGNRIHDNDNIGIDIAGYEHVAHNPAFDRARNGYIAGNTVFNISSLHNPAYRGMESADGIYVDGGADVVIERNLVHDTDLGIEAASEHFGHTSEQVTIRSNIVYASNQVGVSIGGYANRVGGTADCIIVNNTLYGNGTARNSEGEFQIQFHATGNRFMNNIAAADNAQNLLLYSFVPTPAHPATLDDNLYDAPGGPDNSDWEWLHKSYSTFTGYQKATGNDAESSFGDPLFVDPATFDFRLARASPAFDAGVKLPLSWVGLFDFAGSLRTTLQGELDQGAYQN